MPGILSRLIDALIGDKDNRKDECGKPQANAPSRGPKEIMQAFGSKLPERFRNRTSILAAFAIILLSISVLSYVKLILAISFLILIGALSKFTQFLFPFVVGFDFCLFFTVLVGVDRSPSAGIFVGVVSSTLGCLLSGRYGIKHLVLPAIGYLLVGYSLAFFSGASMFYIGMASTVIYAVSVSVMFWLTTRCLSNTLTLFVTTLAYNYWLFSSL